jgi:predicted RNA-binding protein YlxR (DUF448 family)
MLAEAAHTKRNGAMRERRCIVTGQVCDDAHLIRFVVAPGNVIVPDLAADLPGRGIWVSAGRAVIDRAIAKNLFAKATRAPVKAPDDLSDRVESLIVQRMQGDLGLARRAGELALGFDNVVRALESANPPGWLVEARDGAEDGRRKIAAAAKSRGLHPSVIDGLTSAELSVALGRENVIHAALKNGRLATRLGLDAERLKGFRATDRDFERSE